ncbi:MAG: hypothetical protein ACJATF_001859 [Flavobacteriales bacterium]|jgi:hypothetical protein
MVGREKVTENEEHLFCHPERGRYERVEGRQGFRPLYFERGRSREIYLLYKIFFLPE